MTLPVIIRGRIVAGRQLGRKLGFRTANIEVAPTLDAENGVYRSRIRIGEKTYDGMSNLGVNPSVGECPRRLETHIFSWNSSLYGQEIEVELIEKIRDEEKFNSLEELQQQIEKDKEQILLHIHRSFR